MRKKLFVIFIMLMHAYAQIIQNCLKLNFKTVNWYICILYFKCQLFNNRAIYILLRVANNSAVADLTFPVPHIHFQNAMQFSEWKVLILCFLTIFSSGEKIVFRYKWHLILYICIIDLFLLIQNVGKITSRTKLKCCK